MNTPFFRQAAGLLALLGAASCMDPISDVAIEDWTPEVAAPLLQTSFTLRDAISNTTFATHITEDAAGALHVGMTKELFNVKVGQQFKVPKITLPLFQRNTVIDFNDLGIDMPVSRIDLETVEVIIKFTNDYGSDATILVESDNFTIDETSFAHRISVPAQSSGTDTLYFDRTRLALSDQGKLSMSYRADLADGQTDVQLFGGSFTLEAKEFAYAEGYLSDLTFDLGLDSVSFDFLDAFEPGTVALINPRAKLVVDNSVGAPVRLSATSSTVGLRDGRYLAMTSPLDRGLDFLYPTREEGNVIKTSELLFDRETSNLETVLNYLPNSLNLGIRCAVNADTLKEKFFIYRDAVVRGRLEVDVPLALKFTKFEIRKALAINTSSFDEAESASFLLRVENGFGLGAAAQVRFLDRDSVEIATLFPAPVAILAAAQVDAFGRVIAPSTSNLEIEVSRAALRRISSAASAEVVLTLDSPTGTGAQFTQLFYDNSIAVKLGAKVSVKPL